uniref:Uncharacterized protein n=1 Tax=Aegilops tauschii TaxID=37682 RepID=N1R363_AEGTA
MQRCVEDDCRRAEVWCFQLQRQPVDAGKSYNHGGQPQFLLDLPFAARPRSCRHLFLQEGDGGGWASPQIEGEVRRELDDGVLRPSPPGLPWPVFEKC